MSEALKEKILKAQAADANVFDVIVSYIDRDRT